jgi:ABC-type multidrug transport system fused ATPase/permease subunit
MSLDIFKKLMGIFALNKSINFFLIVFFSFVAMILEVLSIALVIPLVLFVSDEKNLSKGYIGQLISTYSLDRHGLIILILFVILIAYFIKNLFLIYLYYKQSKFSYTLQESISNILFKNNILRPFSKYIRSDSSIFLRELTYDVAQFTSSISGPFMTLLSEIMMILGILIFLMVLYPFQTFVVALVFFSFIVLFQRLTREKLISWGRERQSLEEKIISHVNKINKGMREVKVYGLELMSIKYHEELTKKISKIGYTQSIVHSSSRLFIEQLAVTCILLSLFYAELNRELSEVISTIIMFSLSAFRVMPSLSRIITNLNYLKYSISIIDSLHDRLFNPNKIIIKEFSKKKQKEINFSSLELKDIDFSYDSSNKFIISKLSLTIRRMDFLVIEGKSGSGKTTLVSLICGLIKPSSGYITINGSRVENYNQYVSNLISYVPQDPFVFSGTIEQNITYGVDGDVNRSRLAKAIIDSGLADFVKGQTLQDQAIIGEDGKILSGGQKQRLAIARALYRNSQILILDEATSSLDYSTKKEIFNTLLEVNKYVTIIFITHDKFIINQSKNIFTLG